MHSSAKPVKDSMLIRENSAYNLQNSSVPQPQQMSSKSYVRPFSSKAGTFYRQHNPNEIIDDSKKRTLLSRKVLRDSSLPGRDPSTSP